MEEKCEDFPSHSTPLLMPAEGSPPPRLSSPLPLPPERSEDGDRTPPKAQSAEVTEPGLEPSICLILAAMLLPLTVPPSGDCHMVRVTYSFRAFQKKTELVSF